MGEKFLKDYHNHSPLWNTNRRDMLIMTTISGSQGHYFPYTIVAHFLFTQFSPGFSIHL